MTNSRVKKVTVNLPADQVSFLMQIADDENLSFTDVLRRAIKSEQFFVEQEGKGNRVLVEESGNRIFQILRK